MKKYMKGHSYGKGIFVTDLDGKRYYPDDERFDEINQLYLQQERSLFETKVANMSNVARMQLIEDLNSEIQLNKLRIAQLIESYDVSGLYAGINHRKEKIAYIKRIIESDNN